MRDTMRITNYNGCFWKCLCPVELSKLGNIKSMHDNRGTCLTCKSKPENGLEIRGGEVLGRECVVGEVRNKYQAIVERCNGGKVTVRPSHGGHPRVVWAYQVQIKPLKKSRETLDDF